MRQVGTVVTPRLSWTLITDLAITLGLFELVPPVLVQMTVVREPSLQLLQFAAHLPPLLCKAPCFCPLLFSELAMLGSSLRESRKPILGPRASGRPSMELTAAHRESSGALAWRTFDGSWLRTVDPASLDRRAMIWGWFS